MNNLLILLSILTLSCSVVDKTYQSNETAYQGVSFKENPNFFEIQSRPDKLNNNENRDIKSRALHFVPAFYDSSKYLGSIQAFEEKGLNVNAVSGQGLSAIVAFFYAFYGRGSLAEWHWYQFLNNIKKSTSIYKEPWRKQVSRILRKGYGRIRFRELKKLLVVPLCKDSGEVTYLYRGDVIDAIMKSFVVDQPTEFGSCISSNLYRYDKFEELNVDELYVFNAIGKNFKLRNIDNFIPLALAKQLDFEPSSDRVYYLMMDSRNGYLDELRHSVSKVGYGRVQAKKFLDDLSLKDE